MSAARMPAACAPSTSADGESPIISASPGATPSRSSASAKMRGSGLVNPTTDESMTVAISSRRPISTSICSIVPSLLETTASSKPASRNRSSDSRTPTPTRRQALLIRCSRRMTEAARSSDAGSPGVSASANSRR